MREARPDATLNRGAGRGWRWPAVVAAIGFAAGATAASPVKLNAEAWMLQDFHTGRILAEHEADRRMEPASLVKLMTSYVAFARLEEGDIALDEMVTVSRRAWKMGGSQMFIEVGSRVSVEDLLKGIIVQSGNDASVAIAEHVAGTEEAFVQFMNEHAVRLGMTGTSFANSHGLPDPDNYTTARDVAILMRALMRDFPEMYAWHAQESFTYNNIKQPNRNRLLKRDPSVDGGKTGYTKAAGGTAWPCPRTATACGSSPSSWAPPGPRSGSGPRRRCSSTASGTSRRASSTRRRSRSARSGYGPATDPRYRPEWPRTCG